MLNFFQNHIMFRSIALSLQILELEKYSVAEILNVKVREINNSGNNFLFDFLYF